MEKKRKAVLTLLLLEGHRQFASKLFAGLSVEKMCRSTVLPAAYTGAKDSRPTKKDLSLHMRCFVGCVQSEVTQGKTKKRQSSSGGQRNGERRGKRMALGFLFTRNYLKVSNSSTLLL